VPYRKHRERGTRGLLLDGAKRRELRAQIVRIVSVEGPIHRDLLIERLKELNGVARVGENVASNIERAMQDGLRYREFERLDSDFFRPTGRQLTAFRIPGEGVERRPDWIPVEEIGLAVLHLVEDQFGCQREALPRAVAELFGFGRTPAGFTELVGTAVDALLEQKRLHRSGPNLYLP
jgi:hypothetical protein